MAVLEVLVQGQLSPLGWRSMVRQRDVVGALHKAT